MFTAFAVSQFNSIDEFFAANGSKKLLFFYQEHMIAVSYNDD
jgi:hypothetical protein